MELSKQGKLISPERSKLITSSNFVDHNNYHRYHQRNDQPHTHTHTHPKKRIAKMFNEVQVVYYLTRNGHLEHPHYIEVSHLATQPLRLRDVIERLTILRGKAMPCQYSWSCKRSYKNGYVWNDLTENDAIYATEGSEFVLKGSELIIQDRDFSAEIRLEEHQNKGRQPRKSKSNPISDTSNGLIASKPHQRHSFGATNHVEQQNGDKNNEYESEEEEKRVSCNSSNAIYAKPIVDDTQTTIMQLEHQEDSFSIPSTSSTISDKPPQPEKTKAVSGSESKGHEEGVVIEEDGDPHSTALIRNPVLLQLIGCGGLPKAKKHGKGGMGNALIPCLKQQLSSRGVGVRTSNPVCRGAGDHHTTHGSKAEKNEVRLSSGNKEVVDDDDLDEQDMIMVRYMSENPRFWNLQSQEKEYFSGTIVETMARHHTQPSFRSESGHGQSQPLVLTKSSSYNEQRSAKAGLDIAATSKAMKDDDEDEEVKVRGMIKLCLPRRKSSLSNSTKLNKS